MKKYLLPSIKLTLVMIVLCCGIYFALVTAIGKAASGGGGGEKISANGKVVGYALVGQKFTDDKYFWGRPSAVNYNAAGSAGSNKGPSNPEYLQIVHDRIDSFLTHNPDVKKHDIPAEMVTASGSGLDPHISPQAARIQVPRISKIRKIDNEILTRLIDHYTNHPTFGPAVVNVLKLNVALDEIQ